MTISECYREIARYEVASIRHELYGEESPGECTAYRTLALLYELRGEYRKAAEITIDALSRGSADSGAVDRLNRLRSKYGYEIAER